MRVSHHLPLYSLLCSGREFCQTAWKDKDRFLSKGAAEGGIEIIYEKYPNAEPLIAYFCNDKYGRKGCKVWHMKTKVEATEEETSGGFPLLAS